MASIIIFSLRGDDKLIHLAAQKVKQQDSMNEIEVKGTSKNAMKPLTIEQLKAMATQNINSIATAFRNAKNAIAQENTIDVGANESKDRAEAKEDEATHKAIILLLAKLKSINNLKNAARNFLCELESARSPSHNLQKMWEETKNILSLKPFNSNQPQQVEFYNNLILQISDQLTETIHKILAIIQVKYNDLAWLYKNSIANEQYEKNKVSIAKQVVRELQLLLDFSALLPDSLALKAQYLNLISDSF